jgi:hypothetical protein
MTSQKGEPEGGGKGDRVVWVDLVRGIAIMLMIPANLSPYYAEPHAMWYRFMSSLAAPMFISLSAGMVILNSGKHHFNYYLIRGAAVMLIGVLLDILLWRILPFASVDVLYLIGLGIPLIYVVRGQGMPALIVLGGLLMIGGPLLQALFGYHTKVLEIKLGTIHFPAASRVIASWFVDGYFPLLPWLGYALIGAFLFKYVTSSESKGKAIKLFIIGLISLGIGVVVLFVPTSIIHNLTNGGILSSREGYSEIFYPPTYGFLFFSNGTGFIQVALFMRVKQTLWNGLPTFFGKHAMLVYISHQALAEYGLKPVLLWTKIEQITDDYIFVAINILIFVIVAALCAIADLIKKAHPPRNVFLQIILGK